MWDNFIAINVQNISALLKKLAIFPSHLVSDIPAEDGKIANLFLQCDLNLIWNDSVGLGTEPYLLYLLQY